MAVYQNDPFPGTDYLGYQNWEKVVAPNGQVYYVVPGNPGYVYDPVASAASGRKVFRVNPKQAIEAQREQEAQLREANKQAQFNGSIPGQLIPVAGTVGGLWAAHEFLGPGATAAEKLGEAAASAGALDSGGLTAGQAFLLDAPYTAPLETQIAPGAAVGEGVAVGGGEGTGAGFGGGGALGAEGGRNVLGMGDPGMFGGMALAAGSVLAGKEILHNAIFPAARSITGYKPARPMTPEEITGSTGNLDYFLGSADPGVAKQAIDSGLLKQSRTKRDPGEDMSKRDMFFGPQFNIFSNADLVTKAGETSPNKGFMGLAGVPLSRQLEIFDSKPIGSWSKATQEKAAAARQILAGGSQADAAAMGATAPAGFEIQGAPPVEVRGAAPAVLPNASLTPAQAAALGAIPVRSATRSPGIDLNGNRIRY